MNCAKSLCSRTSRPTLPSRLATCAGFRLLMIGLSGAVAGAATFALTAGDAGARPKPARAAAKCALQSADGTGVTEKIAKFQVYEGVLKATDAGLWMSWMATGTTPGYAVRNVKYRCGNGSGLGVSCRGSAKVCKV